MEGVQALAKKRGPNFSSDDCDALATAWLNTSLDYVVGNGQKSDTFWNRIAESFHTIIGDSDRPVRSTQSLQST